MLFFKAVFYMDLNSGGPAYLLAYTTNSAKGLLLQIIL